MAKNISVSDRLKSGKSTIFKIYSTIGKSGWKVVKILDQLQGWSKFSISYFHLSKTAKIFRPPMLGISDNFFW